MEGGVLDSRSREPRIRVRENGAIPIHDRQKGHLAPMLPLDERLECGGALTAKTPGLSRQLETEADTLIPERLFRHAHGGAIVNDRHEHEAQREQDHGRE
jgi:hypothetical protein